MAINISLEDRTNAYHVQVDPKLQPTLMHAINSAKIKEINQFGSIITRQLQWETSVRYVLYQSALQEPLPRATKKTGKPAIGIDRRRN